MIPYEPGSEPDLWLPKSEVDSHRFILGRVSGATELDPPLIAICMNPSHANSSTADATVQRLIKSSIANAAKGWVMLNLYPERATNQLSLKPFDAALSAENCDAIERVITKYQVSEVLVAWGDQKCDTLRRAKHDVLDTLDRLGVRAFTFEGLTEDGNPYHPMRRRNRTKMWGTKIYLKRVGDKFVLDAAVNGAASP